jgi:aspartyl-tRNA(Asn)/glutamyl-tRNA(Gln) amidotransferase subunit B
MNKYTPIIGLEVHVELKTNSKMFCGCSADYFGKEPNTHTCPVCLGMPGGLPVPNKKAIDWCVLIALALNCQINKFSKFDRKNYYYPDLAKGYQISQYDMPFGHDGSVTLKSGKTIRIRRVHMEEDTGKLSHQKIDGEHVSLIDFNRSGVPLVEIVTEPDFNDASEVTEYLQKLQQIVRYLNVSNADMDKGDMRLEPNISLQVTSNMPQETNVSRVTSYELPKYKVEVKNINSFKFVEKAIAFELERQTKILNEEKTPVQETRGWDEDKGVTFSQRVKEEAMDYRYFPEPDIPPIRFTDEEIGRLKSQVPELRDEKKDRFVKEFRIPEYDAAILTRDSALAEYFEHAVALGKERGIQPKQIANIIINKKIRIKEISEEKLLDDISLSSRKEEVSDENLLEVITRVLSENEKAVQDYKSGKESVIMFLVGQVMRTVGKKIDPQLVKKQLQASLAE